MEESGDDKILRTNLYETTLVKKLSKVFDSRLLQYAYFIGAVLIDTFSKVDFDAELGKAVFGNNVMINGIIIFVLMTSLQLVFCRHASNTLLPFMLISCFTLKCYNAYDELMALAPWAIPLVLAILLRLFVFNFQKFKMDDILKSLIPVAVAVTLGGLGTITFPEYKKSVFFVFGLGIGMILMYYIYSTQYKTDDTYDLKSDYTRTMCLISIFAMFMILHYYHSNWETFVETKTLLTFQWRNNITTIMIIAMPFLFLAAHKYFVFFPIGILSFITMFITSSRGGTIFGFLELLVCIFAYFASDKKLSHRILSGVFAITFAGLFVAFLSNKELLETLSPRIFDFIYSKEALHDEARYKLIFRAKDDFLRNPIFGSGLGYSGNADLYNPVKGSAYFYHSAPLQIVGSLGILGILAYGYQLFMQAKVLIKAKSKFALYAGLSIVFLWGMSVVNPGVFSPVPYAMLIPLHLVVAMRTSESEREKPKEVPDNARK